MGRGRGGVGEGSGVVLVEAGIEEAQALSPRPGIAGEAGPAGTARLAARVGEQCEGEEATGEGECGPACWDGPRPMGRPEKARGSPTPLLFLFRFFFFSSFCPFL